MPLTPVPPVVRTVLGASAITTLGTLPVFLLSSQSVFVREELGFGETRFGLTVAVFFGAAAVTALLGGGLADRLGRRLSTVLAGVLGAVGGFGVALGAHSWVALTLLLVLLGVANAACQVTANLTMAHAVPPHRRGLGFGVKQSAIPVSIMLAGLAVPVVAATLGWRWTFVMTGVGGLVIALSGLLMPRGPDHTRVALELFDRPPRRALVVMMMAIVLGAAAANSLGSFLASWGYQVGLTPSQAGLLMAAGSAANVVMRVLTGHLADRRHGRNLPVVAAQMLVGAVGLAFLSVPTVPAVLAAGLVSFAVGWSWPGLALYAVVRVGRDAPAAASGYVQAGAFIGGAAGPALFGVVVGTAGYERAWQLAALTFLLAALLVLLARRFFLADLVTRPPRTPLGYGGGRSSPARTTPAPGQSPLSRAPRVPPSS